VTGEPLHKNPITRITDCCAKIALCCSEIQPAQMPSAATSRSRLFDNLVCPLLEMPWYIEAELSAEFHGSPAKCSPSIGQRSPSWLPPRAVGLGSGEPPSLGSS
jgi:hypothetical protein